MTIDIRALTAMVHSSYIGSPYPEWEKKAKSYELPDLYNISESRVLGKPYFMTLSLQYQQQVIVLPNEPLVAISIQKTIVETPTVGHLRKGTVKEYICTEDYNIEIKGICIGENGNYPARQVKELNDLFAINAALEIKNNLFFNLFNIQKVVLRSLKFDEMMGQEAFQRYTLNAVSDQPFFAELNDKAKFLNGK